MRRKSAKRKPKLSDAERHKRFVAMAHEVEAHEAPDSFDRAFRKVTAKPGTRAKEAR